MEGKRGGGVGPLRTRAGDRRDARQRLFRVAPGLHRRGTLEHWMIAQGWQCLEEPEGAVTRSSLPVRDY